MTNNSSHLTLVHDAQRAATEATELASALDGQERFLKSGSSDDTFGLGGGPPGGDDMNERIAKLEARADFTERQLDKMDGKLDAILGRLGGMPTTNGIWGMIATVIAVGIAIAGLTFAIASYASSSPIPPV